jgi:predicted membrane protein DUF2157
MNPDVVEAIERLRRDGILTDAGSRPLERAARGELVSVEAELRTLLYAGVVLITAGVGLFLKENHERLGPVAIGTLLALAAAVCLGYAWRRLPPFTWGSAGATHLGADYVLLLGVLLIGADLGYLEVQLHLLGAEWPYHLLVGSVVAFLLAYRFDSRSVLSLALTSFAAWRGVAVSLSLAERSASGIPAVRANALACGVLFVAAGIASARTARKPHFEPVYVRLGLLLLFGALLTGAFGSATASWFLWEIALLALAAVVIAVAYRLRRPLDFSIGVLAAYFGLLRILFHATHDASGFLIVAASSVAVVVLLIRAQRRMREDR